MACPHLEPTLAERHPIVVPMGNDALKRVLGLQGAKKVRIQDFHGTVQRDPQDRFWVVPTFHPSFLQRGAHNLIGTVLWDLRQAEEARDNGKVQEDGSLAIDPPLEWFRAWVDQAIAARTQDPTAYPLSCDIETPDKIGGKDEGEITVEDRSFQILRVNLAISPEQGITVPFSGPYMEALKRLHQSPGPIWMWNRDYDFQRLIPADLLTEGDSWRVIDLMWLWHHLQSDLPRGLGFVAPFYSSWGPWKHLADREPATYGAIDGLQTHRVGFGIIRDLITQGMYEQALRHKHQVYWTALRPAHLVGVKIDRHRLEVFKAELTEKAEDRLNRLQEIYPAALLPLTPTHGLSRPPPGNVLHVKATAFTRKGTLRATAPTELKMDLYKRARIIEKLVLREVMGCKTCGMVEVPKRHKCKAGEAAIVLEPATVARWFWQEPFNPDSPPQVLAYLKYRKHQPGRAKKTKKDSTDRETLDRLEKKTGDPFYRALLDYRAIAKVKGTYVEGTEKRLDTDDRVHPIPTFRPSMGRLSYLSPNITNVVADKEGKSTLAAGFRRCVVASPGCRLLEVDFAGIEALKVGYRAQDPDYIRLAQLGVHAGMATHVLGKPFKREWLTTNPEGLAALFKEIKSTEIEVYERSKRFVHGRAYGLTAFGMVLQFPEIFPSLAVAQRYERIFAQMAPKVEAWQRQTQERAHRDHYLGGPGDHPYGYRHWFWAVFTYKRLTKKQHLGLVARYDTQGGEPPIQIINGEPFKISLGEDGKRALAFYGQSIAAGDLMETLLALFDPSSPDYIGDAYWGQTPLRAPIHDSLFLEIPLEAWDRVVPVVYRVMLRPLLSQPLPERWGLGPYLSNRIAAKAGLNWAPWDDVTNPDGMKPMEVPGRSELEAGIWTPTEEADREEGEDLRRTV